MSSLSSSSCRYHFKTWQHSRRWNASCPQRTIYIYIYIYPNLPYFRSTHVPLLWEDSYRLACPTCLAPPPPPHAHTHTSHTDWDQGETFRTLYRVNISWQPFIVVPSILSLWNVCLILCSLLRYSTVQSVHYLTMHYMTVQHVKIQYSTALKNSV